MRLLWCLCFLLPVSLAACAALEPARGPSLGYRKLTRLFEDSFEAGGDWRAYSAGADLFLGPKNGGFHIDFRGRQYVWTQGQRQIDDALIEVEAVQTSAFPHNAFGLACRLDPSNSGRGYFFLISGDGYASIRWSDGRSLQPLVPATPAQPIRRDGEPNRIRAVCIGDYLALWVNGHFLMEARDSRRGRGAVGLAGLMNYGGRRLSVQFDELEVWAAARDS